MNNRSIGNFLVSEGQVYGSNQLSVKGIRGVKNKDEREKEDV